MFIITSSPGLGHSLKTKTASDTRAPVWRIDLRSVGFTGLAPKQETWGLHFRPNPLCFADQQVLVATFITRENVTALARRDQPDDPLPLRLHGTFLDASTGKVQASREWPITRPRGGIVATGGGGFAVLVPAGLASYSPSRELLKDLKLSSEQQSHLWDIHSSPTGKSFLMEYHYPEASFQWVDANSLQPQPAWGESMPGVSISDSELTITRDTYIKSKGYISEVLVRSRDGPWRAICRVEPGMGEGCGIPQFVSNKVLALWLPHELKVASTDGEVLSAISLAEDDWIGRPLYPSANGERFAMTVWAHKGGSTLLDISYHRMLKRIVVYDIPSGHPIYTFEAKKRQSKDVSGVAVSPDGSLLAILTDGVLEVYQLPSSRDPSGSAVPTPK
ncbi:hypothetical protein SBA7_320061 [Candidatus Sulfotelmatobacter sp. SbA7]|nr:hypothetical protein SBA7_320061 [Candidatus Sulfotelmatobacter sp. SbA7]